MADLPSKRSPEFENMDPPPEYSTVVKTEYPQTPNTEINVIPAVYSPTNSILFANNSTNENVGFQDFGNLRTELVQISDDTEGTDLTTPEKHRFMRNVFGLLLIKTVIITGIAALFAYEPTIHQWILDIENTKDNFDVDEGTDNSSAKSYMSISALMVYIFAGAVSFLAIKNRESLIVPPANFVVLGVLTLLLGYPIGILAALDPFENLSLIPYIGGTVGIVCLALVMLTFQSKLNLAFPVTGLGYIFIILLTIVGSLYGIVSEHGFLKYVFGGPLYVVVGLSFYFYVMVRMMLMRDWSRVAVSPKEYVLASVYVYFGIVIAPPICFFGILILGFLLRGRFFLCFYRRSEPTPQRVYILQRPVQSV